MKILTSIIANIFIKSIDQFNLIVKMIEILSVRVNFRLKMSFYRISQ